MRANEIIKFVKGERLLDVGCTGHIVELDSPHWLHGRLREKYPDMAGIDISETNIAFLKSRGFSNLYVQSAEDFELQQTFDTIIAGELIEHLANPGKFLEHAKKHLAPGGQIVLTTPYAFSLLYIAYAFYKFPKTCQNEEHTVWFCPQTIRSLAERHKLRVDHWHLIEDYRFDIRSTPYQILIWFIRLFKFAIPKRLSNNTMLVVLTPDAASSG